MLTGHVTPGTATCRSRLRAGCSKAPALRLLLYRPAKQRLIGCESFEDGSAGTYSLIREDSESHFAMSIAIYPSFDIVEGGGAGHVFLGVSAHSGFENDGFTNTPSGGSTAESAPFVFFAGGGYGIEVAHLRLSTVLAASLTTEASAVRYWPAGFLSLGGDITLWNGRTD